MPGTMPALQPPSQPVKDSVWFNSRLGLGLIRATQRQVTPLLTSHIGVRGLYLRPSKLVSPLLSGNMLQSMVSLHCDAAVLGGDLRCDADALPIESDAISLVYALHALDVVADPAALLAECVRVLQPESVMFVISLSTTSPWRVRWGGGVVRPLPEARLRGLLVDSGMTIEQGIGLGPVWPGITEDDSSSGQRAAPRWLPDALRASLLLVARKRRAGMMPLAPRKTNVPLGARAHAG